VGNESCQRACVSFIRVAHLSNAEECAVVLMQLTSNGSHDERCLGVDSAAQGLHGFAH
jgi:hypothetical protein